MLSTLAHVIIQVVIIFLVIINFLFLPRILKMDPAKKFKAMLTMQMSDVTALTISPDDGNQLAVLHLRCATR